MERNEYDSQGRVLRQYNGEDELIVELTYNADGTTTVRDGLGNIETHAYDRRNTLIGETDAVDASTQKAYDGNFRPTEIRDPLNQITRLQWSPDGNNLEVITDTLGSSTTFTYDTRNHLTTAANLDGTEVWFIYNTPGAVDPLTGAPISNAAWDEDLLLMQVDNYIPGSSAPDANRATRYFYTSAGDAPEPANLVRRVEAPEEATCFAYNNSGQQIRIYANCVDMDPATGSSDEDVLTGYSYDPLGRMETISDALGYVTRYVYSDADDRADVIIRNYDPLKAPYEDGLWNLATVSVYDSSGRLTDTISNAYDGDLNGNGTLEPALTVDLNSDGAPEYRLEIDPDQPEYNLIFHTRYDAAGRVVETITNHWPGQPAYHLDLYNLSTRTFYDRAGRVAATVENYQEAGLPGWGTPVSMDFDGDGQADAALEINPDHPEYNRITQTSYDPAGRVSTTTQAAWPGQAGYYQPAGTRAIYNLFSATEYDPAGNILKTVANYDPAWMDSDGDGFSFPLILDPSGSPVTVTIDPDAPDRNQVTCTQYDALNRPLFVRTACLPGQADYLKIGESLYNLVTYQVYDEMGRQIAGVRNYEDNGVSSTDGILELTTERNFITRSYYDDLGRVTYTVENFVGDVTAPTAPAFDPALPDRNQVTRYDYDAGGRQYAVTQNYWEPGPSRDGILTQAEIEAGLPDRNRIARTYFNGRGQVTHSVQNFVGDLNGPSLPIFDPAHPDRNLITAFQYDLLGRQVETRLERGTDGTRANLTEYDPLGRAARQVVVYQDGIADPLITDEDAITVFEYDVLSRLTASIDPAGRVRQTVYDALGRTKQTIQDPGGLALTSAVAYDVAGQAVRQTNGAGELLENRYDPLGRVLSTLQDPGGLALQTETRYDLLGHALEVTDAKGLAARYEYDNLGRLVGVLENSVPGLADSTWPACLNDSDGTNVCARYLYDDAGNRVQATLGNGSVTGYQYDALGRLVQETLDPGGQSISTAYSYDAAGNRIQLTRDPGGMGQQVIVYTYDALGRVKTVDYPDTTPDVSYTYHSFGSRASMVDGGGAWSYTYDRLNRLVSVTDSNGETVGYTYDPAGNRSGLTLSGSPLDVDYAYDGAGRLGGIPDPASGHTLVDYSYDGASRLSGVSLPNGVVSDYSYDPAGRLASLVSSNAIQTLSSYTYQVDALGNRTSLFETLALPGAQANRMNSPAQARSPAPGTVPGSDFVFDAAAGALPAGSGNPGHLSLALPPLASDPQPEPAQAGPNLARLPLSFTLDPDQANPEVRFQVRSLGGSLFFTPGEVVLALSNPVLAADEDDEEQQRVRLDLAPPSVVRLRYIGANPHPEVSGMDALPGVQHDLRGDDPEKWRTYQPTYAGIRYTELYPGIDLRYEGRQGFLKSTFYVWPGGDPQAIRWRYNGSTGVQVDEAGDLQIHLPGPMEGREGSILSERAPVAWQELGGERIPVWVQFQVDPGGMVSFSFPEGYDPSLPLQIDPELSYSTYLGSPGTDEGTAITVDDSGNLYVTGYTHSYSFPQVNPVRPYAGSGDVVLFKLNPAGDTLLYSTYLGGSGDDAGRSLVLDSAGRIVLAGETESANFPTTANAFDRSFGGGTCSDGQPCDDVFVTVLAADGSALDYSTYLGGGQDDDSPAVAVDLNDHIHVGGWTASSGFPVQNAFDSSYGGGTCGAEPCADGFVTKLDPGQAGSASLLYSSYLGGGSQDEILAIAVDGAGLTYLTGYAQSSNFPTLNPLQASRAGGQDVVVVKMDLSAVGTASLLYATYLGGSSTDRGEGIGLDGQGKVYLTGFTQSANFPTTANAFQPALGGGRDAMAVKIDLASNSLVYATFLGGGGEDQASAIAVDGAGNAHLTGLVESLDFPVANAIQASKGAEACSAPPCQDAFAAGLDPSGSLLYSTYLGGGRDDFANGIALDGSGAVYLTGATFSADFPTTPGSYSPTPQTTTLQGTKLDLFIARISAPPPPGMAGSLAWRYAYDGLSRLASACSQWDAGTSTCLGESFSYSYDGAGNARSFSRWGGSEVETVSFVYNGANQIACRDDGNGLCGDAGDTAYAYDAYGNLTSDGMKSYAYDAENRLVSVTDGASITTYTYNGDGERMSQTQDGVTTRYVLDTAAPLTMVLAETSGTDTIYYLHGLDLVAQSDGVTVEYFGYDGLGSVRQMLDSTGGVLFAQVFDPYGNPYASMGMESTSFGFTGEQTDRSGLVYLRARWYVPKAGRFIQLDQWQGAEEMPMSLNHWLYVYSNPINFTDPTGKCLDIDLDGTCDYGINKSPIGPLVSFDYGPFYNGIWKDDGTTYGKGVRKQPDVATRWQGGEKAAIRKAAQDVARAYARAYNNELSKFLKLNSCGTEWYVIYQQNKLNDITAFYTLHGGTVKFIRRAETATQYYSEAKDSFVDSRIWAEVRSSREIFIFDNVSAEDIASHPRFVAHELGHAFESALYGTIGRKAGREGLSEDLWFRNVEGVRYGGFAGGFENWQWSQSEGPYNPETGEDGRGEIFADMFIGWVYGQWGNNVFGSVRERYMNNNMPDWIFTSILNRGLP